MKKTLILAAAILLTGCQAAGERVSEARGKVSAAEVQAHKKGLCAGNLDVLHDEFANDPDTWRSLFKICGLHLPK